MPTPVPHISISKPVPPSVISKGIKYIKINRFDKQGNDNTLSLQELTNLRVKFSDLGIVDFPILTISEYPDYYLYRTANVILGNSTEEFNAPINPSPALTLNGGESSSIVSGYTDVTGSIDGSGLYTFINGGYGVTIDYSFLAIGDPFEYIQVIFTGSNGIAYSKTFNNENLFGGQIQSASFTYVPTSGSTLGMMFSASASNMSPTYVFLSSSFGNSGFNITQDVTSSIDNNILDHAINTSKTGTTVVAGDDSVIITSYNTLTTDTLGYFNTSSGLIIFGDTPNVKMYITASVTVPDQYLDFSLFGSSEGRIVMTNTSNPSGGTLILSASFTPIENSTYWLFIENNVAGASSYSNVNLLLTQSIDPHSSTNLTVLQPYLLSTFTDSDCDVLMNNANGLEYDVNFMKVDYDGNGGLVIPSNQQEILNNTAERAPVKPYNYRLLSQILPRYNGIRATSLFPNKWTGPDSGFVVDGVSYPGDYNTFGKLPVVDLSNIFVAYCDVIEENTPEINGASYAHIKYLIDENGNIRIPNVSENSLPDVQDTFITNENISIYSSAQNAGEVTNLKSIIRGGQRVETVLYNQSGYGTNPIPFTDTISLADNNTISGLINDYQALLGLTINYNNPSSGFFEIPFDFIYSSASAANNIDTSTPGYRLKVTAGMVSDNIGITFKMNAQVYSSGGPGSAYFELHNFNTGTSYSLGGSIIGAYATANYPLNIYVGPDLLTLNDEWGIRMTTGHTWEILQQSSPGINQLQIIQSPVPQTTITTALSIWQSASGLVGLGDNILFTTQSQLVNLYGSPTLFQQQIAGSGFNTSSLNWNLLPGDEFRFEGREDMVYMVERAFIDSGSLPSASLIVNLDRPLASSSVGGTFDVNHFMIRRYINDPSSILFSGAKPFNSIAPYIIKPQYVTNLLNKNIDKYVIDLTGKGIITP
jgi:hypothetical protein